MRVHFIPFLTLALIALPAHAADLTFGSRVLVSENNQNFNISVFDGAAGYDNTGTTVTNPPLVTNTFGDGTVVDYNFFHSPGDAIVSYAKSGAGLVSDATSPAANINGAGENWSNVWTVTDPVGFTTTKDFTNGAVANTFARAAEVDGTIDISNLTDGQIYFMHGTFNNGWTLAVTMSGPNQPDIVATTSDGGIGGNNRGYVSDFTFSDAKEYLSITYNFTHGDRDGSRARFMGVVLDGSVAFDPGDTDGDFLDDIWEDEFFGDNSGTVEASDLTATDGSGDADGDLATDRQEFDYSTNPNVKDSDMDGLEDGPEINTYLSNPKVKDSDMDGLEDGPKVHTHGSDPILEDTDGDTLLDGDEVNDSGPLDTDGFITEPDEPDTDTDGVRDDVDTEPNDPTNDNDGDGLSNVDETDTHGTDPLLADTDGDGVDDGDEVNDSGPLDTDGFATNPLITDTDGDGFNDGDEASGGSDPTSPGSIPTSGALLSLGSRTLVSTNNANFDISVFPGAAMYNDRGAGGTQPGSPTFTNMLGDGDILDYNFVGNDGTGSALTTYATAGTGRIPTPTAPGANVHGGGEDWANVWTASDPGGDFLLNPKDHNPTNVAGAANTWARSANVTGTVDIADLRSGTLYFPHGTFVNDWTLTVTMSGPGQTDVVAVDTQGGNGTAPNRGWINTFGFTNPGAYDTITYTYTNTDTDGSRARFMGVILDAIEDQAAFRITNITYTPTIGVGDVPENIVVDLTFTSKEGKTYTVYHSNELTTPVENRPDVEDSLPGAAGQMTTTFTIDFNDRGIPLDERHFFVVKENL